MKYMSDLASDLKDQPTKFWKSVSYLSGKGKSGTGTGEAGSAQEFNDHFLSFPLKTTSNLSCVSRPPIEYLSHLQDVPPFSFSHVDEEDVLQLISELNTKKATGPDQIPPFFIKKFSLFLLTPVTEIINKSFDQCIIPSAWKVANIIPIQKKMEILVCQIIDLYRSYLLFQR